MCYDGVMVMPNHFVAIQSDEMEYVDGGIYLSASQCATIGGAAAAIAMVTKVGQWAAKLLPLVGKFAAAISAKVVAFASSIGPVGTIVALVGAALLLTQIGSFMTGVCGAIGMGTGVDMTWTGWFHSFKYR